MMLYNFISHFLISGIDSTARTLNYSNKPQTVCPNLQRQCSRLIIACLVRFHICVHFNLKLCAFDIEMLSFSKSVTLKKLQMTFYCFYLRYSLILWRVKLRPLQIMTVKCGELGFNTEQITS